VATRRSEQAAVAWREGRAEDLPAVSALVSRAFDPRFREGWTERQMADVLLLPRTWLTVGHVSGDGVVAFALCRETAREVELLLCAVDPRWQRRGLGVALIARTCAEARARRAQRIFLEVRDSNGPARALYAACGFRATGRRPSYYRDVTGGTADAITLTIELEER
jgi:ribosomal-protein-alanine N-acetyltransferase